jgi:hypothetical protein
MVHGDDIGTTTKYVYRSLANRRELNEPNPNATVYGLFVSASVCSFTFPYTIFLSIEV